MHQQHLALFHAAAVDQRVPGGAIGDRKTGGDLVGHRVGNLVHTGGRAIGQLFPRGRNMIRDDIKAALITAMKGGDKESTAALRLIQSAIKNRDIEARTQAPVTDDDAPVVEELQKMVKERSQSIDLYKKGGRPHLAAPEATQAAGLEAIPPA